VKASRVGLGVLLVVCMTGLAAEPEAAGPALSVLAPDGVVSLGDPVRVRIGPGAGGGPLTLTAEDAAGTPVTALTVAAAPGAARVELEVPCEGRRWLRLRLAEAAAPAIVLAERTVAVLPPAPVADRRFGFNAPPALAPLVRRLGALWVRNHIPWEQAGEGKPFGGNGIENTIGPVKAAGCETFGISSYSLPWASVHAPDDPRPMREFFSPPRPEAWDAYVRDAAARMAGRVPVFEVWNEPNFDHFWRSVPDTFGQRVADYSALLRRTAAILREAAPETRVTNGSVVDTRHASAHAFLRALLEAGCGDSFDILNIHYYNGTRPPERLPAPPGGEAPARDRSLEAYLDGFRQIQAEFKTAKPVWMTEMGWPTVDPGGWGAVSEAEQAQFMVRSHVLCFAAGVESVLWFQLAGSEFGLWQAERGPKPGLVAYAQLMRAVCGRAFRCWLSEGMVRAAVFGAGEEAVIIAWSLEAAEWRLPPGARVARAENMLGEACGGPVAGGIRLDGSPVYLFGAVE